MYYPDGSYAGINEIVFNFQEWLDWYLQATGQHLVGGNTPTMPGTGAPSAGGPSASGPSASVDATSGASA